MIGTYVGDQTIHRSQTRVTRRSTLVFDGRYVGDPYGRFLQTDEATFW